MTFQMKGRPDLLRNYFVYVLIHHAFDNFPEGSARERRDPSRCEAFPLGFELMMSIVGLWGLLCCLLWRDHQTLVDRNQRMLDPSLDYVKLELSTLLVAFQLFVSALLCNLRWGLTCELREGKRRLLQENHVQHKRHTSCASPEYLQDPVVGFSYSTVKNFHS